MNPEVSIIIPCYNAAPWISATLDSALGQTGVSCEIIVVDDGSTDESATVAREFAHRGVQVIEQTNQGAAVARNTGLNHATGEFIQFLDADDLLAPDKLQFQMEQLKPAPAETVVSAAWARFSTVPTEAAFAPDPVWIDSPALDWLVLSWSGGGMMHPAAWLTPATVARKAGPWNETLSLDDDGEYFARVLLASAGVIHCRESKVYYRTHHSGSLSQNKTMEAWRSSHEVCYLLQKVALAQENSPRVRHACALNHLRFAFNAWPHHSARKYAQISLLAAHELSPSTRRPRGGPLFETLARLVGWKLARRLHHKIHHE